MFDLEAGIRKWRAQMAAGGLESPEVVQELEEHLREEVDRQVRAGIPAEVALADALQRIGKPQEIRREFERACPTGFWSALRRHRWKLFAGTAAGLMAAALAQWLRPAPYQSEARLLLRYEVRSSGETRSGTREGSARQREVSVRTRALLQAQLDILTSDALAQRVAAAIGPGKILAPVEPGRDLARAAAVVQRGLRVSASDGGASLVIAFRHPNPAILQPVAREVIDQFLRIHVETFRPASTFEVQDVRVTNISQIRAPSPPAFDLATAVRVTATMVAAGALAGIAWMLIAQWNHAQTARRLRRAG